jgi:hypothetical protein
LRLARWIITYWLAHNLDYVEDICTRWVRGHRLERIKFETLALALRVISWAHGYGADETGFITDAMKEEKE